MSERVSIHRESLPPGNGSGAHCDHRRYGGWDHLDGDNFVHCITGLFEGGAIFFFGIYLLVLGVEIHAFARHAGHGDFVIKGCYCPE